MRNLFILTLFVVFAFNSFAQTAQPVRITNFGTYTGDQVKALRGELREEFDKTRVLIATSSSQLSGDLSKINDQLEKTNNILQKQYDDRWGVWQVIFLGLFFLASLTLILWGLADAYLRPLRNQQLPANPPAPPTPPAESSVRHILYVADDEEGDYEVAGDRASENAIIVKGNSGNVNINISKGKGCTGTKLSVIGSEKNNDKKDPSLLLGSIRA